VTATPRESPGIFKYAYIEDPWGVRIEMVEDTEHLGFHHVHLRVKDPEATLAWYQQQFGGERAKLRGKVDGVRFNGVWVFAMGSGADTPPPPTAILLIALRVNDVDTALKNLNANGIKTASEPRSCRRPLRVRPGPERHQSRIGEAQHQTVDQPRRRRAEIKGGALESTCYTYSPPYQTASKKGF
jgi:catechol 2,3-dioxygenase-like lactoylglutathione lyase family enzyme